MQTMARMFTCLHSVCILRTGSLKIKLFYLDKSSLYLGLATYTLWSNITEKVDAVVQVSRTKIERYLLWTLLSNSVNHNAGTSDIKTNSVFLYNTCVWVKQ